MPSLFRPLIIEFNEPVAEDLYKDLNTFCGFKGNGSASRILAGEVRKLMRTIGAPLSLQDCNVSQEKFEELYDRIVEVSAKDPSSGTNPRDPKVEKISVLVKHAFTGTPYSE